MPPDFSFLKVLIVGFFVNSAVLLGVVLAWLIATFTGVHGMILSIPLFAPLILLVGFYVWTRRKKWLK